jgi:hypothetical protein
VENRELPPPDEEQQDSAISVSLQPPPLPPDWVMSPSGQMISPEMMKSGKDPADNDPADNDPA